jgi:hypothetical protein
MDLRRLHRVPREDGNGFIQPLLLAPVLHSDKAFGRGFAGLPTPPA